MRETLKTTLMFAKNLGKIDSECEKPLDIFCPDCGQTLLGIQNNVTHHFDKPMKRCKCDCGYKGFYPVIKEDEKNGME